MEANGSTRIVALAALSVVGGYVATALADPRSPADDTGAAQDPPAQSSTGTLVDDAPLGATRIAVAPPAAASWSPAFPPPPLEPRRRGTWGVLVEQHLIPVYDAKRRGPITGRLRGGVVVPGTPTRDRCGLGKNTGRFIDIGHEGRVCDAKGLKLIKLSRAGTPDGRPPPDLDRPLPHRYVKIATDALPIYERLPVKGESLEDVPVAERAEGAYWLALDERVRLDDNRVVWTTLAGTVVEDGHFDETKHMPTFFGEALDEASLPLAFAHHSGGADVECREGRRWSPCGSVAHHGRFHVAKETRRHVYSDDGWRVRKDDVRVARERYLPFASFKGHRWVHFDLDEQTMVAYESKRPVYATLISSGKGRRFQTPNGAYRIRRKYLTKTMTGPDPDVGRYHIEDIPWTMYYRGGYAVHGAFWHEEFGNTRSHGCTNLAPADARWLYFWSSPSVPAGWHAELKPDDATWFYFERDS